MKRQRYILLLLGVLLCLGTVRAEAPGPRRAKTPRTEHGSREQRESRTERPEREERATGEERNARQEAPRRQANRGGRSDADPARRPHMTLTERCWNFGDVARKGADVAHDFCFRNDGDAPLVILRVITSCSCIKASFPKRPVAPGESGVIRITYEPRKSEPGRFNKVVQLLTNSASGRELITVQGNSIEGPMRGKTKEKR